MAILTLSAGIRAQDWAGEHAARTLHDEVQRIFEDAREDVYRYLLTLGLYPPQAQETAQEVFLRLYVAMRGGEQIQNPRAWVFRVAHNLGLNVRARESHSQPFDPEFETKIRDGESSPEQSLLEKERLLRLHRAIASLSPQQRQCLHLRAEGLRYHEIASALGITNSTVGEFLRRAVSRLRKAVHE
jgi:RNA polymerase sigma-70 factor (ECF subfamily)